MGEAVTEKASVTSAPRQPVSGEALLVALVVAPGTYSRNKFFSLFEDAVLAHARRRAQMVRSLLKELTEPWEHRGKVPSRSRPDLTEEREQDGMIHLSYAVRDLEYRRSARLTHMEYAALCYALCRAGQGEVTEAQKLVVENALLGLLSDETSPLSDETAPLSDETSPLSDETSPLSDETQRLSDETEPCL